MKKLLMLSLLLVGCSEKEKLVKLSEHTLPKTVMVEADVNMEITTISFDGTNLNISKATETVTIRGSGVAITKNGHILTAAHLFEGRNIEAIRIHTYHDIWAKAELLYLDAAKDLALIKANVAIPTARIADPRKMAVGQEVLAIGNPLGLEFSVSHGIISALYRDFSFRYNMTQSDAFINPGNSGGPLFNMKGELVGINSMIITAGPSGFSGLGFSVSSAQIIEFLSKFRGIDSSLPKLNREYWK